MINFSKISIDNDNWAIVKNTHPNISRYDVTSFSDELSTVTLYLRSSVSITFPCLSHLMSGIGFPWYLQDILVVSPTIPAPFDVPNVLASAVKEQINVNKLNIGLWLLRIYY